MEEVEGTLARRAELLGVEHGKLKRRGLGRFVESGSLSTFRDFLERVFAGKSKVACDLTLLSADRMSHLVHIEACADDAGHNCNAVVTDISELHAAQQQLARQMHQIENAELQWKVVFDSVSDPIFLHDSEFRILRCNKAYQRCAGIPFNNIIGRPYHEIFPKAAAPLPCCLKVMEKGVDAAEEEEVAIGAAVYRSRSFPVNDKQGTYLYSVHIFEDITAGRRAEAALLESEEKFRKISESAQGAIIMMGADQRISFWNAAAERIFGYSATEAQGQELHALIVPVQERGRFAQAFPRFIATGKGTIIGKVIETTAMRKGGEKFPVSLSVSSAQFGGCWHAIGIARDITERKRSESAIQHANRALVALGAVNRVLVHATDEQELLQAVCQSIVEKSGYRLVWVGYKQHDEHRLLKVMAHAGDDEGFLETLRLTWAENKCGMLPSGRAIRSGKTQLCQDITSDPLCLPWREEALKRGYASGIALPLINGDVFGVLVVLAGDVNAFTPNEVSLLEEMAGDLAFGVQTLHIRSERDLALKNNQQQHVQLQNSLEATVRAIATMVEMRDPYTAGHQVRMAGLAAAIARQMGLSEDQQHAIRLAGTVHDLGKIQVPAEILSKPGKLSATEFSLIKEHPQNGYDILKGIDFPWPIAQMVLQHHERLDGSGYPRGLAGDDILLEARILCVADVVEALSSHRPYRPGFGMDFALAEITQNRGIRYDPQVVDVCLALFREQHYLIKD